MSSGEDWWSFLEMTRRGGPIIGALERGEKTPEVAVNELLAEFGEVRGPEIQKIRETLERLARHEIDLTLASANLASYFGLSQYAP